MPHFAHLCPSLACLQVRVEVINPKSISMNELYGAYDLQTMEWTDGVLSSVFRGFARDEKPDEKWLILDGPVDTLWIEVRALVADVLPVQSPLCARV